MSTVTRQPRGISTGGQFAATPHQESGLVLEPAFTAEELQEFAKPLEMPPGSAVYIDGQRGIVSSQPVPKGRIVVDLDQGGSVYTKASDAVPWDGWLEVSMPAVDQELLDEPVPSPTADRMLHTNLRALRNALDSATDQGDPYHAGRAQAAAETAASILDTGLDADGIRVQGRALMSPATREALRDRDALAATRSGAPITPLRARQLAGHFADAAVMSYAEAMNAEHRGSDEEAQAHHGRTHTYLASAIRFVRGCEPDPHSLDREQAMVKALIEGADRPNELIRAGLAS